MNVIWINGAFGAGKTTVVEHLLGALPTARVFDPEIIGSAMRYLGEDNPTDDFQDIPLWRRMVADTAVALMDLHGQDLVVPMTLVVESYVNEIVERIEAAGHQVEMFWLEVPNAELERRITAQVIVEDDPAADAEVRQWRLDQIDRCQAAAATDHTGQAVPNHGRPPADTVGDILHRLGHPA